MSATRPSSRPAARLAAATTVVTLLAVVGSAPAVPRDAAAAGHEGPAMRAFAAAVVAAIDLLGADRATAALPVAIPGPGATGLAVTSGPTVAADLPAPLDRLDDRLLDLPPPGC
jgi:hypothetical protein